MAEPKKVKTLDLKRVSEIPTASYLDINKNNLFTGEPSKIKVAPRTFQKVLDVQKQTTSMKGEGEIEAILSTVGDLDKDCDKMMKGCFDDFLDKTDTIPMLWVHNSADIIGIWKDIKLEGDQLIATGKLFEPIQRAREASHLLAEKLLKGVSIGFTAQEYDFVYREDEDGTYIGCGFNFMKVNLLEASLVLWPANTSAEVESIKNSDGTINLKRLERYLAKTDLSRAESSTIIKTLSLGDPDGGGIEALSNSADLTQSMQSLTQWLKEINAKKVK